MNKKSRTNKTSSANSSVSPQKREFSNDPLLPARPTLKRRIRGFYRSNKLVSYSLLGLIFVFFGMIGLMVYGVMDSGKEQELEIIEVDGFWMKGDIQSERFQNQVLLSIVVYR